MKYKVKKDVWQDKVTGQRYTRDYAFRPLVSLGENGEVIRGYTYEPYGVAPGIKKIHARSKEFGFPAYCFGQKLFLTAKQVEERFEYIGKLDREENIAESIKQYSEEECDFENLEWLAEMTLRDLTHDDAGGLSQCVQAKLLEHLLNNAPNSDKMERIKNIYFNNADYDRGLKV